MGQLVYILGKSGSGKSYSMRNFPKDKFAVINVQGKILPFKGSGDVEMTATDKSTKIIVALKEYAKKYKSIVIDDYQYTMANEFMRRSDERGYDKFTEIGRHAWDIANAVSELPSDVIVYILCHTDRDDEGNEKIKTIGKLLDEKICLEGMSSIVLKTMVSDGVYSFVTQTNGKDTCKSPADMFPTYAIDNDLYYVDQKIRNYYHLGEFISDEEAAEIDEIAKNTDIIKPTTEKKSRRAKAAANNDSEPASSKSTDGGDEAKPKRNRRRATDEEVAERESEREEVAARNAEAIANHGTSEDGEPQDFDKVGNPTVEELPRRKRRTAEPAEVAEEVAKVSDMLESAEEVETADATPRRRRRR